MVLCLNSPRVLEKEIRSMLLIVHDTALPLQ